MVQDYWPSPISMKVANVILGSIAFFTLAFVLLIFSNTDPVSEQTHPLASECVGGHSGLADHYHPMLVISVLGNDVEVPGDIGINQPGCTMRPLHTHDSSGKIHVEFKESGVEAPLKAFFDTWGKHMDENGFDEYRVDENHEFLMFLSNYSYDQNGNLTVDAETRQQVYNFENLILEDRQYIELVFREKA